MSSQRLMRAWYKTDVSEDDPEYVGAFSHLFPAETMDRRIISADWSKPGEVEVTWLISA